VNLAVREKSLIVCIAMTITNIAARNFKASSKTRSHGWLSGVEAARDDTLDIQIFGRWILLIGIAYVFLLWALW
jgi:hypothetical protein